MTIRDINELIPLAQKACRLFMAKCREAGLDVFITETYRPQSRQNELWEQGRTKPGKIVTDTMHSRHTSRRAWDIACNGPIMYDIDTLNKAGAIARSLGITWGGDWIKPVDKPHFEIDINWQIPEEDEELTQEQFNKMMDTYLAERERQPVSDWAKEDWEKAKAGGITDGNMPQAFATREQVISLIRRAVR